MEAAPTLAPEDGLKPIAEMGTRTKVIVMIGTMLGLFTAAMDQTIVATSMPRIIADLGGFGLFSWVGTGFMLASTATVPVVGKLSDIYGRKPFYMGGIILLLIGSALCGMSQTVEQLIAFRVIQGLGAGCIMGIAFAILGDVFTPAERGRWAGLMSAVFASASVIGPLIGGSLTDHANWRWVFYINIPLGLTALAVLFFGMPNLRSPRRPKIDYLGITLLLATVTPLLLGLSWAGSRYDWVSPEVMGCFLWAGIAFIAFLYVERRAEEPVIPLTLFENRIFNVSAIVTLTSGFAMMGSLFYLPLFVQGVIGASATNSGFVTMPMMIAMAIASAIAGQLMSRLGKYRILGMVGLAIMVGGMFMLSRMDVNSTSQDATIAMIVFGIGVGMSMPLFMLAVQNAIEYRYMGVSTSTIQFLRSVGGTMGVAVMFSVITASYHSGLTENVPAPVQERPEAVAALKDPQFLLNDNAFTQIETAFGAFGEQGEALFAQTIEAVKVSLADGITNAFFISTLVLVFALVVSAFMKEIPLRKAHYATPEPAPMEDTPPGTEPTTPGARPELKPVAGGSDGHEDDA